MSSIKEHIIFKGLAVMLMLTLLAPIGVKFAHLFTHHNHKHDVCKGEKKTHLHALDTDCDFYKFQLNKPFILLKIYKHHITCKLYKKLLNLEYKFLSNHRPLSFSLRGPPALV